MTTFYQILFSSFCIVILSFSLQAQSSNSVKREIGLTSSDFKEIGVVYKKKNKKGRYLRLDAAVGHLSFWSFEGNEKLSLHATAGIGFEKRKKITDKLGFFHGSSFNAGITGGGTNALQYGFNFHYGYILGVQYALSDAFGLFIETIPSAGFSIAGNDADLNLLLFSINADISNIHFGIVHRFESPRKKKKKE
ncbi:MAG: hypothetical protein GY705_08870 [Bacteroidetes bacterium]|nr:hypothetical protein [Bacteroidota bacterium]